jgi:hypothetical protein
MKKQIVAILSLLFILGLFHSQSAIAETVSCRVLRWPISRKWNIPHIKSELDSRPREEILQMAWGEILLARSDSMALPLVQYLINTEQDSLLRGYYMALGMNVTGGASTDEAIKKWPTRPLYKNKDLTLKGLCQAFEASHGRLKTE